MLSSIFLFILSSSHQCYYSRFVEPQVAVELSVSSATSASFATLFEHGYGEYTIYGSSTQCLKLY